MYAQVVVLTYQSPEIGSYAYEIPKELERKVKIGQLVAVPFGKRKPLAVVLEIINKELETNYQLKEIDSTVLDHPILLPYQIKLLKWMSGYYIAPMVNCLETMLPQLPSIKHLLVFTTTYQHLSSGNQTIVLVPSINHLPQVLAQFPQAKNYVIYHNELKASERFAAWQKILSGQTDYVFGSRSAIFTPCPKLKKIVIYEEHDSAYKDERSPYFDTLTLAEKICELTQAKIDIIDSSPKISTFFNHSKEIKIPNPPSNGQTKIISLENERKLGNYSPISSVLEEIIKRAYSKKLSILLYLNKKIESGSIYCKNCKHQQFFKSQPEVCPNCKSTEIFFNSTNIHSLAKEVKKNLPNATINILTEKMKQSTIDIATASVFYKLIVKKYDLVAHIYCDSPLNFNEYSSPEEIYSQVINLKKLTKKLLVIQTYNKDLPAVKFAASNNYSAFYQSELNPRKALNFPPFSLLIKITVSGKKEIDTDKKAQKLFNHLKQLTLNHQLSTVNLLGPYKPVFQKILSYNITLKIPLNNYSLNSKEKALEKISKLLPRQKDVRIIVEPKNLNQ